MRQSAEISLEGGSARSPNLSPVPFPLVPETEKEGTQASGQHLTSVPRDPLAKLIGCPHWCSGSSAFILNPAPCFPFSVVITHLTLH